MTGIPHPSVAIAMAEEHRLELLAQAERYALARTAQPASSRERWPSFPVVIALAVLLLAIGFAAAHEPMSAPQTGLETGDAPVGDQASDELINLNAARRIASARW